MGELSAAVARLLVLRDELRELDTELSKQVPLFEDGLSGLAAHATCVAAGRRTTLWFGPWRGAAWRLYVVTAPGNVQRLLCDFPRDDRASMVGGPLLELVQLIMRTRAKG